MLESGSVIDYIFPVVTPKPTVIPFDETLITKMNNEIESNLQMNSNVKNDFEKIKNKIKDLSVTESIINNKRLQYQSDRDQKVDNLISVLGLQNTYNSKEPSVPTSMPTSKPTNLIIEKFFAETPKPVVSEFAYLGIRDSLKDLTKKINNKTSIKKPKPTPNMNGLIEKPKSVIIVV